MSKLSDITSSIKDEINSTPAVEETVETVPETSSETTKPETVESTQPVAETAPEAPETAPKPDLNNISDIDKATYSFKKQMNKQRSKYESDLAELRKQIEELKKPQEPQKFRDNFENDDQYIDYLVEQRFNKMMSKRDEEEMKRQAKMDDIYRQNKQIDDNIAKHFTTPEAKEDYRNTVSRAFENGLEELLDNEQYVRDYLMKSPNGPKILYELAKDTNKVNTIFTQPDPMSRLLELKMLERDLMKAPVQPAVQEPAPEVKPVVQEPPRAVGKPGINSSTTTDIWSDNDALKQFIRKHR